MENPNKKELKFCDHVPNINSIIDKAAKCDSIHKEQCTECFIDHTSPWGIDLCLTTFKGSCVTSDLSSASAPSCGSQGHCASHYKKTNNRIALNIRKKIELTKRENKEITKLAINTAGGGGDDFIEVPVFEYRLQCYECKTSTEIPEGDSSVRTLIKTIQDRTSSGMSNKIKAWELEILPCDHSRNLPLLRASYSAKEKVDLDLSNIKCSGCDLKTNIWLCLICGHFGCGRKHFDGSGGNGHANEHKDKTKHPLTIKLGTLGGKENVSSYCYLCNNDVKVDNLMQHLVNIFGEKINKLRKTEKTINEMSLEINLNFELSKAFEAKEQLVPLNQVQEKNYFWGIANIGNSCYMNSVVQALTAYPEAIGRLLENLKNSESPLGNEICKLFKGIRRSSEVNPEVMAIASDNNVNYKAYKYMPRPYKFRELVGKGHSEFETARQQDAAEYFFHLLTRFSKPELMKPLMKDFFRTPTANKLVCSNCKSFYIREAEAITLKVEIPPEKIPVIIGGNNHVNLKDLLGKQGLVNGDEVLRCEQCKAKKVFDSQVYLRGFPENLILVVRPFYMEGLVAKKMDLELGFEKGELVEMGNLIIPKEEVNLMNHE
jgi:ubiquitin carboxyl-terminal hydrolase 5/13